VNETVVTFGVYPPLLVLDSFVLARNKLTFFSQRDENINFQANNIKLSGFFFSDAGKFRLGTSHFLGGRRVDGATFPFC